MNERWNRRLVLLALLLALTVVGASSYLRLAGNGLGCKPWPECYGTEEAAQQSAQALAVRALRITHRITASLFLVIAVLLVVLGWRRWSAAQRAAGAGLLAVTLMLAIIGRFTPSALPWITWANMLGGFFLISSLLWLLPVATPHSRQPSGVIVLVAAIVLQVMSGALLSSRLAAAECTPACTQAPGGNVLALVNPQRAGSSFAVTADPGSAVLLHTIHRLGGFVLVVVAGVLAVAHQRGRAAVVVTVFGLYALGIALVHRPDAAVGAAHALAAAWLLALLARPLRPLGNRTRVQGETR